MALLGTDNYKQVRQDHQGWAAELLGNVHGRDDKWTRSIAIGNRGFVEKVKAKLKETGTDLFLTPELDNHLLGYFLENRVLLQTRWLEISTARNRQKCTGP